MVVCRVQDLLEGKDVFISKVTSIARNLNHAVDLFGDGLLQPHLNLLRVFDPGIGLQRRGQGPGRESINQSLETLASQYLGSILQPIFKVLGVLEDV